MQKWEYLWIHTGIGEIWENSDINKRIKIQATDLINIINQKGDEGWELITVAPQGVLASFYFKRPKD